MMGPVGIDGYLVAMFREKWWLIDEKDKEKLREYWRKEEVDFSSNSGIIESTD